MTLVAGIYLHRSSRNISKTLLIEISTIQIHQWEQTRGMICIIRKITPGKYDINKRKKIVTQLMHFINI